MPEETKKPEGEVPAVETPTPAPTAQELEKQREEFTSSMFGPKPEPEPEKPEAPAEEKPVEDKPVEAKVETPPPAAPTPDPDDEEEDEEVSVVPATPTPVDDLVEAKPETPAADLNLTPGERRKIEAIRHLEATSPEYKGLAEKTLKFWKDEEAYEAAWKKDPANKGRRFNPDDDEHQDFYDGEPEVDSDDLEEARVDLKVQAKMAEAEERMAKRRDPEIEEIKAREQMRAAKPKIKDAAAAALVSVFNAVPEFAAAIKEGAKGLTDEKEAALEAKYPVLYDVVATEADRAFLISAEIAKFKALPNYRLDEGMRREVRGEIVRPHAEIRDTFYALEDVTAAAPKAKQVWNGKEFARYADVEEMKSKVHKSGLDAKAKTDRLRAIGDRYYTITLDDVDRAIQLRSQKKVQRVAERYTKESAMRGPSSSEQPKQAAVEQPASTPAKSGKPAIASTSSASDIVDNAGAARGGKGDSSKEFEKAFFGS